MLGHRRSGRRFVIGTREMFYAEFAAVQVTLFRRRLHGQFAGRRRSGQAKATVVAVDDGRNVIVECGIERRRRWAWRLTLILET